MPRRKHKIYVRPKKAFDKARIDEENRIKEKYGLKNKREIWKAEAQTSKLRRRAKELITASSEEQNAFFQKLQKIGLNVKSISDVLALTKEDLLNRRLQTLVLEKKLATKIKQARQFIVHKHISVSGKIVNIPSYMVLTSEEKNIELVMKPKKIEEIKHA